MSLHAGVWLTNDYEWEWAVPPTEHDDDTLRFAPHHHPVCIEEVRDHIGSGIGSVSRIIARSS